MNKLYLTIVFAFLLTFSLTICDARGGRRGGSFGGIFGGWRKYKKPATSSNSRRVTNGSPMHTTLTKSMSSSSSSSSLSSIKSTKTQASYPKQQMPTSGRGTGMGGYTNSHGYGGANGGPYVPPGGTYYANTAAMPPGAIYYAQPPMRSSSGTGDFLFGMMAGHVMSQGLFGHRHHVTHVYHQNQPQGENSNGNKVIIINNGNATTAADTANGSGATSSEGQLWPTDTDVPLAEFNTSITPEEMIKPGNNPIFRRVLPFEKQYSTKVHLTTEATPVSENAETPINQQMPVQPNGIICMPLMFNETDANDSSKANLVEKIVCYPAPPPPPPAGCVMRMSTEIDPNDPTKSIQMPKQDCTTTTTTPMPPVAGEIGERWTTTLSTSQATTTLEEDTLMTHDNYNSDN